MMSLPSDELKEYYCFPISKEPSKCGAVAVSKPLSSLPVFNNWLSPICFDIILLSTRLHCSCKLIVICKHKLIEVIVPCLIKIEGLSVLDVDSA